MKVKIKQVDAFTDKAFGGNPAGVVTDAAGIEDTAKQKIAKEMNLSETAFVSASEVADFKVQFFTPKAEVDLCGHATIATFSTLYEEGRLDKNKNIFYQETKAGVLPVEIMEIAEKKVFMLTQGEPKFEVLTIDSTYTASLLGLLPEDLLELPVMSVSTGIRWIVFGVKSLDRLMNAKPNLNEIEKLSAEYKVSGITPFVMDAVDKSCSYHLRAIAPLLGIAEDPVCGTGNGCVASFLAHNNLVEFEDSIDLIGEEGLEVDRPGHAYIKLQNDGAKLRTVKVGGNAVTVLEGVINF